MGKLYLYESVADTDFHFHFHVPLWVKFDEHFPEPRQNVFDYQRISMKFALWAKVEQNYYVLPADKEKGLMYFDFTGTAKQ